MPTLLTTAISTRWSIELCKIRTRSLAAMRPAMLLLERNNNVSEEVRVQLFFSRARLELQLISNVFWVSTAPAPRFRSAPDPAFASVRLTAHLASSIPTTDTERVNLSNWTSAGLDAAPPPGPSFGNPPDLSEKAWIAARDKDNNAAALLLEEAKKKSVSNSCCL
jgi:hypothetical protein